MDGITLFKLQNQVSMLPTRCRSVTRKSIHTFLSFQFNNNPPKGNNNNTLSIYISFSRQILIIQIVNFVRKQHTKEFPLKMMEVIATKTFWSLKITMWTRSSLDRPGNTLPIFLFLHTMYMTTELSKINDIYMIYFRGNFYLTTEEETNTLEYTTIYIQEKLSGTLSDWKLCIDGGLIKVTIF